MTYREEEDGRDGEREEHSIPAQLNGVELARKNTETEGQNCCDAVPPKRHHLVRGLEVPSSNRLMSKCF